MPLENKKDVLSEPNHLKKSSKTNSEYTNIDPRARVAGVITTATFAAYTTYFFDVFKNSVMHDPEKSPTRLIHLKKHLIGQQYAQLDLTKRSDFLKAVTLSYRGVTGYWAYKLLNGTSKLALQPVLMQTMMKSQPYNWLAQRINPDNAKVVASGAAGGLLGVSEVGLNPIDLAKLRCQKMKTPMHEAIPVMWAQGLRVQYNAWEETLLRNITGSTALFTFKFLTYRVMGVTDHNKPTLNQSLCSSVVGNGAMISFSHPFDLLKLWKQMAAKSMQATSVPSVEKKPQIEIPPNLGMMRTLFFVQKTKGTGALLAGLMPKLLGSGFKGSLVMTACEMMVREINNYYSKTGVAAQPEEKPSVKYKF
jgi:hypothetical protein